MVREGFPEELTPELTADGKQELNLTRMERGVLGRETVICGDLRLNGVGCFRVAKRPKYTSKYYIVIRRKCVLGGDPNNKQETLYDVEDCNFHASL